jgi:outer membrane immunogenic protein
LLAAVALCTPVALGPFAGAARAADLPAAPASNYYTVTPTPYYNWTGIYVGGNAGWIWSVQNNLGITDLTVPAFFGTSTSANGFAGGGQVGFNWFVYPNYVLGIEGDYDAINASNSAVVGDGSTRTDKLKNLTTIRGRLGLTADRVMFYLTAGGAWAQNQITRVQNTAAAGLPAPGTSETVTTTRLGWTAGVGVEYALFSYVTMRLEYLYAGIGPSTYTLPISQARTSSPYEGISELRVGVNVKFPGGDTVANMQ